MRDVITVSILTEWYLLAEKGIHSITSSHLALTVFSIFTIWASVMDIKTLKVKNELNLAFLLAGVSFWILPSNALTLGVQHFIGLVVGFLLLFIPGMIANHAFGGDIKFVAVMGFWIGPYAISLVLFLACLIQALNFIVHSLLKRRSSKKIILPFAPAFTVSFFILLFISSF